MVSGTATSGVTTLKIKPLDSRYDTKFSLPWLVQDSRTQQRHGSGEKGRHGRPVRLSRSRGGEPADPLCQLVTGLAPGALNMRSPVFARKPGQTVLWGPIRGSSPHRRRRINRTSQVLATNLCRADRRIYPSERRSITPKRFGVDRPGMRG